MIRDTRSSYLWASRQACASKLRKNDLTELGFRDRVIDVDGRNLELAITEHLVEMMDTGGRLFRQTANTCNISLD